MRPFSPWLAAAVVLFLALFAIILRMAWLGDDACITLRTIDNWFEGYGLCWNADERVQAYTHPLWMLLLAFARLITGEYYYGTIALGVLFTGLTTVLLLRSARTAPASCAVLVMLICSIGFTDFATSGLENPLTFSLIAAFALTIRSELPQPGRLLLACLLTALAMMSRLDMALMFAPALLVTARGLPLREVIIKAAIGFSPLIAWSLFATIYYGTPFPITAYAKAFNTGVPAGELLVQGFRYLGYVAVHDPATIGVIAFGIGMGLYRRELGYRALALGALLYCCYVIKVGGDFMGSRFFTPPFVASVAILARAFSSWQPRWTLAPMAVSVVLMLLSGLPDWTRSPTANSASRYQNIEELELEHGIINERLFYFSEFGLMSPDFQPLKPGQDTVQLRARFDRTEPVILCRRAVGRFGLDAGPLVYFVDPMLCDPLLMRLPIGRYGWRIGHFAREMPTGYLETVASGHNQIHHPGLARYYDAIHLMVRAPVFSAERWGAIWQLWTGALDEGLQDFIDNEYTDPPRIVLQADQATPVEPGTWWWDAPRARAVYHGGIEVRFAEPQTARSVQVLLNEALAYSIQFRFGGRTVGQYEVQTNSGILDGLTPYRIQVPGQVKSFDSIWIDTPAPTPMDMPAFGGLTLER